MSARCCSISGVIGRRSPACSEPRAGTVATPPPVTSRVRRLLVVDDEPHIGLLLRLKLESRGYELRLARSLFEARAILAVAAERPDALLLDLHLPDGSGGELLRE